MNDYSIALFLHIVAVLGMFVGLGLEWIGLSQIRGAQDFGQVRVWMGVLKSTPKLGFPSMLAAVVSGLYMMWRVWGGTPWVIMSIGALVLIIVLFAAVTRRQMTAVGRALGAQKGPVVSQTFHSLANHPLLWISIQTRMAIALGIIFLKIAKPDLAGSLLTIGVAIVLGIASALPASRHEQAPAGSAN
jgi:hypothetical protein